MPLIPGTDSKDADPADPADEGREPTDRTLLEPSPAGISRPVHEKRPGANEAPLLQDLLITAGSLFALVDQGRPHAEGAMGTIVLARDETLGRELALKILREKHRDNPELRSRFLREASITAQLQHPGIPPVFNVGTLADGRPFFAMKRVEGQTLACRLALSTDLAVDRPRFLTIFEQVCHTVAFAHARGVIHRDLKPEHIVVGDYGSVYVMDWGIARLLKVKRPLCAAGGGDAASAVTLSAGETVAWTGRGADPATHGGHSSCTIPGDLLGTPRYMSPEQARGDPDQDERTDVFSLGAILFEILTGEPLRPGVSVEREELARFADADLPGVPVRLDASRADLPIIDLARRCLQRDRGLRPRDASEVAAEVSAYLLHVLQRPERELARFFDLSLDLFCLAGLDGYFKQINRNFTRILGHSTEELLSRPFIEYVHPEDRERTRLQMVKLSQGIPVVHFENRYRDKWDTFRWFEWAAKSLPDEGLIFGVARDVTARKRLEDRFQAIVESFPAAMALIDAAGTICLVNNETEHLFGYPRDEILGRKLEMLIPESWPMEPPDPRGDDPPSTWSTHVRRELIAVRKDGTRFPIELNFKRSETDQEVFLVAVIVDLDRGGDP